ncbi:MAG: arsenate reductase family protein [Candidatus Fimenecus sp.]
MLFIEYPKCTTCQKAKKWLLDNGFIFEARNIKTENPTFDELKVWHAQSGLPLKKFFNSSGLLYKSMQLKEKLPAMSEEEQLQLLATDGMLVKRPLLIADSGAVLLGFREKEWCEALKNE